MNKLTHYILSATLLAVFFFSSCSDDEKTTPVAATLSAVKATSHSLEFSITPQNVEKCAWICYQKGESAPTAEEILNKGIPANHTETSVQKAIALNAETDYIILAAAISEGRYLLSTPLEMKTKPAYEAEIPIVKLRLEKAQYRDDTGNGNYVIRLASGKTDRNELPASVGDVLIRLDLYNTADANPWNATLPNGEYHAGDELAQIGCWDIPTTTLFERIGPDPVKGVVVDDVTSGTVLVQRKGDTYTIDIDILTSEGEPFRGHFKGDIIFEKVEPKLPTGSYLPFDDDQQVTFDQFTGRYYGNWFMLLADDLALKFSYGKINEQGVLVSGYRLNLTTYMHKLADYNQINPPLEEGVYHVYNEHNAVLAFSQIPMTINRGNMSEVLGEYIISGSYLEKIDAKSGKLYIAMLKNGTMTVTHSGENYSIAFDFETSDGHKVTGSYDGSLAIENFCDTDQTIQKPWSNIPQDVALSFDSGMTEVKAHYMGNYLHPELNAWQINFGDVNILSDYITVTFFTEKSQGMTLTEGEYKIGLTFEPMYAIPGGTDYGRSNIYYTWYADFRNQSEPGIADISGPIESGTMKVTKENENYKFEFDLMDDNQHSIQGAWTGKITVIDTTVSSAQ